jgi:hypothetical protein
VVKAGDTFSVLLAMLDPSEPFEVDSKNAPHLIAKGFCLDDALDAFFGDPEFYVDDSEGSADWLMVGAVPGGDTIVVPLAPSHLSGISKVRPITIFRAPLDIQGRYLDDKSGCER